MKRLKLIFVLCIAAFVPGLVLAMPSNPGVTPNEWRLLPKACLYAEGGPGLQSDPGTFYRLREADQAWHHVHHYCWAIVQTFRTYRTGTSPQMARQLIDAAIGNLDYSIDRSLPGFELRPDMLFRKAKLQIRRGRLDDASDTARQLVTESPSLPEGYIVLAEVLLKAGRKEEARRILERGEEAVTEKARFKAMKAQLDLR